MEQIKKDVYECPHFDEKEDEALKGKSADELKKLLKD